MFPKQAGSTRKTARVCLLLIASLSAALPSARATVAVSPLYGNNMVVQRGLPFPVRGTAAPNKTITVTYNGQTTNTTSDAFGNWQVALPAMSVQPTGGNFTITEAGGNTLTFSNVVVGDVWLCSGQSNMAFGLSGCNQPTDISTANFPGIRCLTVPLANLGAPSTSLVASWSVCSSSTAGGFSAVAFYFARTIYTNQSSNIPIGLIVSSVGGTCIDPWLAPEGITDIPALAPLYSQPILAYGPFALFNGMIYPLAPYPMKGAIWYQGENGETTSQSADSYYLKEKGLQQGWKRLLGLSDFALYVVELASYGNPPATAAPDPNNSDSWADVRQMQTMVLSLPHGGAASAIDVGDAGNIHPTDKFDVGQRLALWALKNDYGQPTIVPSGPVLQNVTLSGTNVICAFNYAGDGLMVGVKTPYLPTQPTNAPLAGFVIAGASGTWYAANATISNNTVVVSSPSVPAPHSVAYAYWQNPAGANLYNSNGLPALPFDVPDVTAKYTVTASAGAGGSISPAGATTYLQRMTALYSITPNAGSYILDVQVDGTSVGAVAYYTFDPLYASHTIAATFTNAQPAYTVNASASPGGLLSPTGAVSVAQGGAQAFAITPNPGCLTSLAVDGDPMGARSSFSFSGLNINHTIAASFSCTINASSGYGGAISSPGAMTIGYGSNMTYTITPATSYSIYKVTVDGTNVGPVASYTFSNVTTSHTISASFTGGNGGGSVPQPNDILFSCLVDSLKTNSSGTITSWPTYLPANAAALTPMNLAPTLAAIDGRPFAQNYYLSAPDGFNEGAYSSPVPCAGASIVVVAKPTRNGITGGWGCVVDAFYNILSLGILNDSGKVFVFLNGSGNTSTASIPDGQTTILSMVVQTNGQYNVWANGTLVLTSSASNPLTSLPNGVAGSFANNIAIGNNYPDGWSTFNGYIGDLFFYTKALSDTNRGLLEQFLATRLLSGNTTNYSINASAGTGGTIVPSGAVLVAAGGSQAFTIAPSAGYSLTNVLVDGVWQGPITGYSFTNVSTNHTISASFAPIIQVITATAGANGSISPTGAVAVVQGANQSFTFNPNSGYMVDTVLVDGVSVGRANSYTFTDVLTSHTILVTFKVLVAYTITATAGTNGSISPSGSVQVLEGWSQTFAITPNSSYAISNVVVDGVRVGSPSAYTFTNVVANHTVSAAFNYTGRNIPQVGELLFSVVTESLPLSGPAGNWPTFQPTGQTLTAMGSPTVQQFGGVTWENNSYATGDGYRYGNSYWDATGQHPIPCQGASIVVAVKPTQNLSVSGFNSIVDLFYNCLGLRTWNSGANAGLLAVCLNNSTTILPAATPIPNGQVTIVSLVVQTNGQFKLWTNGVAVYTSTTINALTNLVPGLVTNVGQGANGFATYINIGRENPDGWSVYNGYIGDVFVYTNALSDVDRQALETNLINKFITSATLSYTITASASAGGAISPNGAVSVLQGAGEVFTFRPNTGQVISSVQVDGVSVPLARNYTFANVSTNHTIAVTYSVAPNYTITTSAGANGTVSPLGTNTVAGGQDQTIAILPNTGYAVSAVQVDGVSVGAVNSYTFSWVLTNHTLAASFAALGRPIPRTDQLIFSVVSSNLPNTGAWPGYVPGNLTLTRIGSATNEVVGGDRWEKNADATGDGFLLGTYASPIPVNGITIVAAVKPAFNGNGNTRGEVVDIMYDRAALSIGQGNGQIQVAMNGWNFGGSAYLGNGQITVMSLVVQNDGSYIVYTNGVEAMSAGAGGGGMTSLVPGVSGTFANAINVGRNNPDGWSSYNGDIGDVFVYGIALADADRRQLEADLTVRFIDYTITASAGTGGTISPNGAVPVNPGANQTFTVTPLAGYVIGNVNVDGVAQGALSAYTFTNVIMNHAISAAFAPVTSPTLAISGNGSGGLNITWLDSYGGQLLWSPTLGPGAIWTPAGVTPAHVGGLYQVTVTPGETNTFYGLGR